MVCQPFRLSLAEKLEHFFKRVLEKELWIAGRVGRPGNLTVGFGVKMSVSVYSLGEMLWKKPHEIQYA